MKRVWICTKCDWEGEHPNFTELYMYLGTSEELTENDFVETCPECGINQQVIHK